MFTEECPLCGQLVADSSARYPVCSTVINRSVKKFEKALPKSVKPLLLTVYIEPHNEGHSMNYSERYTETPQRIVERARTILTALEDVLIAGTFSVKIERNDCRDTVYLDRENLYDANWVIIGKFSEAQTFLTREKITI